MGFIYFLNLALPDKINAVSFCILHAHSIMRWKMKQFGPVCTFHFVFKSASQNCNSTNLESSHLDGLEPAWLFDLIVNDRLVLCNSLVSSTREDHVLKKRHNDQWHYLCNQIDVAEAEELSRSLTVLAFLPLVLFQHIPMLLPKIFQFRPCPLFIYIYIQIHL